MEAIFDSDGITTAWLHNNVIYDLEGDAVAFIQNNAVYDYDGRQRGWFNDGYFREDAGHAVGFVLGARNGPLPPLPESPPIAPIPAIASIPPIPNIPAIPPIPSPHWSDLDWDDFIG